MSPIIMPIHVVPPKVVFVIYQTIQEA